MIWVVLGGISVAMVVLVWLAANAIVRAHYSRCGRISDYCYSVVSLRAPDDRREHRGDGSIGAAI